MFRGVRDEDGVSDVSLSIVTIQPMKARSCIAPPGNAERLLGNASTNPQGIGAHTRTEHNDDIPIGHFPKGRADARRSQRKTHPHGECSS